MGTYLIARATAFFLLGTFILVSLLFGAVVFSLVCFTWVMKADEGSRERIRTLFREMRWVLAG